MDQVDLRSEPSSSGTVATRRLDPKNPCELLISKSKYLSGLQCHKLLWHAYNAKHLIPAPDAQQQAIFDQGHEVGQLAQQSFPGGIEVGKHNNGRLKSSRGAWTVSVADSSSSPVCE